MLESNNTVVETSSFINIYKLTVFWISFLKKKINIIIVCLILSAAISYIYAINQPVIYDAKITFIVEDGKSGSNGLGGLASLAGQFGVDVTGNTSGGILSGENIILYFKSVSLAREVLTSPWLNDSSISFADIYTSVYDYKKRWIKANLKEIRFPPLRSGKIKYTRIQDSLLNKMASHILENEFFINRVDKKAGFISVTTTMNDEMLSKVYCEKIVQIAIEKYIKIRTERQKKTVEKLQNRADSISRILTNKTLTSAVLQTSSSTMDINPLYKTNPSVAYEASLRDKSLLGAIFASVTQNLELAKFTLSQETPVIQIIDRPVLPLEKTKVSLIRTVFISVFFTFFFTSIVLIGWNIFFKQIESYKKQS